MSRLLYALHRSARVPDLTALMRTTPAATPALSRRRFLTVSAAAMASALIGVQTSSADTPAPIPDARGSVQGPGTGVNMPAPQPPSRPGPVLNTPTSPTATHPATTPPPPATATTTATPAGAFNVTQYGAKGNGTADDTAAIQRAIAAVPAAGGTVFFPVGTYIVNPAAGIKIKSNLRLVGASATTATLKVKPHAGNWTNLVAPADLGAPFAHFSVETLGFDANIANNLEAVINSEVAEAFQTMIYAETGNDLHVRKCHFRASGVWVVSFNGPDITDCSLTDNTVDYVFNTQQGGDYDNSCYYIDGTHYTVTGNTLTTPPGRARAAIELHGGPAECSGNKSTGFQTMVNITNQYVTPAGPAGMNVHDNKAVDAIMAIRIQPITGGLRGVVVANNDLHLAWEKHLSNDAFGIGLVWDNAPSNAALTTTQITGNTITFSPGAANGSNMDYHNAAGIGLNGLAGGDRIAVTGNTITGSLGSGVMIGQPGDDATFTNLTVSNNTIPNPAQDGTFPTNFRDGVAVWVNTPHCTMLGNTITDNGGRVATPLAFTTGKDYSGSNVAANTYNGARVGVVSV